MNCSRELEFDSRRTILGQTLLTFRPNFRLLDPLFSLNERVDPKKLYSFVC